MASLSGVKGQIADFSGKTLQNIGDYTIIDTAANILAATTYRTAAAGNKKSDYIALYGAKNIIATDWSDAVDLSSIDYTTNRQFINNSADAAVQAINDPGSANFRFQVDFATGNVDRSISAADAAKLATVDQFNLTGNTTQGNTNGTLTIDADAFVPGSVALAALDTISAETGGNTNNLIIADVGGNNGTNIDLKSLATLTDIDAITITGDTGANQIQLSSALTTHGSVTLDLVSDSENDVVIFNISDSDFKGASHSAALGMTLVSNFNVTHDQFAVMVKGSSGREFSTATSSFQSGTANLNDDLTFVEYDSLLKNGSVSNMNNVSEIKTDIARAIANFTSGADRLTYATYLSDGTNHTAVLAAADLAGVTSDKSNLVSGDSFEVAAIAELRGVQNGALGTVSGFNMTEKPNGFS